MIKIIFENPPSITEVDTSWIYMTDEEFNRMEPLLKQEPCYMGQGGGSFDFQRSISECGYLIRYGYNRICVSEYPCSTFIGYEYSHDEEATIGFPVCAYDEFLGKDSGLLFVENVRLFSKEDQETKLDNSYFQWFYVFGDNPIARKLTEQQKERIEHIRMALTMIRGL